MARLFKIYLITIAAIHLQGCLYAYDNSYNVRNGQYIEVGCNWDWCSSWSKNSYSGKTSLLISPTDGSGLTITATPDKGVSVTITTDKFTNYSNNITVNATSKSYSKIFSASISKKINKNDLKPYEYVEGIEKYRTISLSNNDSLTFVKDISELWDEVILSITDGEHKYTIELTEDGNRASYFINAYTTAM